MNAPQFTTGELIDCIERELKMRVRVYTRLVLQGKMTQGQAERERALMAAVLETLKKIGREQGDLGL